MVYFSISETPVRSREEDDELQRSTKKVKESHRGRGVHEASTSTHEGGCGSYKEKLLGEILGAYEQAFALDNEMEDKGESESDDETSDLSAGIATVNLSGERKARMRRPWTNALIVKVFGKSVGYHFLVSRLGSMWKPSGKMSCVDLGFGFILVRFTLKAYYSKILSGGFLAHLHQALRTKLQVLVKVREKGVPHTNGEKTNAGVRSSSVRGTNFGHKSKQNSRSQKGLRSKFSPEWKALGPTLVEEKSQMTLEKENWVLPLSSEFMEFKAGSSTSDPNDKV
ncbi:hypothetical protein CMV_011827 [Castanea mollissima]|uniref:Uncharacterized protein n=1 Tax=Castanea mollissima TaxID=60419 RepID=A0A8J4RGN6_9ROSI|nr:hypothetical protein CMV_011827 [Castanea mollissima]